MCLYVRGKEQKRLEKEDYIQQLGKPKYKVGEEEEEVSYDILGSKSEEPDRRVLFKHIRESKIVNIKKNSDM